MNPENQKQQNTNPDLDFIRNADDPLQVPTKKRLDKKIIIIIILVVITLVIMVIGMVTGANKKVQKSSDTSSVPNQTPTDVSSQKEIALNYMTAMSTNDIDQAKSFLADSDSNNKRDLDFEQNDLWKYVDLKACQVIDAKSSTTKIRVNCIFVENKLLAFSFNIGQEDGGSKITKYTLWIVKGLPNA
ncbi:MAG TPA: hypothetical protein PKB09_00425 [Candidatus Saccharibacteria bacterium]|nr:hypothetical protein [Candidatus Saccharibacteria bacterium]